MTANILPLVGSMCVIFLLVSVMFLYLTTKWVDFGYSFL